MKNITESYIKNVINKSQILTEKKSSDTIFICFEYYEEPITIGAGKSKQGWGDAYVSDKSDKWEAIWDALEHFEFLEGDYLAGCPDPVYYLPSDANKNEWDEDLGDDGLEMSTARAKLYNSAFSIEQRVKMVIDRLDQIKFDVFTRKSWLFKLNKNTNEFEQIV